MASAKKYPTTNTEFNRMFKSEAARREYLSKLRWPKGFVCPGCRGQEAWVVRGVIYKCSKCKRETSLTAGTLFQKSNLTLWEWFKLAWETVSRSEGASAALFNSSLDMDRTTSTDWRALRKLQQAMKPSDRWKLSGEVEFVDTTLITRGKRPRRIQLLVQRRGKQRGEVRMAEALTRSRFELTRFIEENVEKAATVYGNDWRGCASLSQAGYRLKTVRRTAVAKAENVADELKRYFRKRPQAAVRAESFVARLNEFAFRFNSAKAANHGKAFYQLLKRAVDSKAFSGRATTTLADHYLPL